MYGSVVDKLEGRRPLWQPRHLWVRKVRWIFERQNGGVDWIGLANERDKWSLAVNGDVSLDVACSVGRDLSD